MVSSAAVNIGSGKKISSLPVTTMFSGSFPFISSSPLLNLAVIFLLHTALTLMLSLAAILSPGILNTGAAAPTLTSHFKNSLPEGAVNSQDGSVYLLFFVTVSFGISPLPPLASKITSTEGIGLFFHTAFTVTLPVTLTESPGILSTGAAPPTVTDHLLNSLPSGAPSAQAGRI